MKTRPGTWATALMALAGASPVQAHHSITMFQLWAPIWLAGTVVSYEPVNPHVRFVLEETTGDGTVRRWSIEGPALRRLGQMGVGTDFIEPGDVLEVCGFPPKAEFSTDPPSPDTRTYPPRVVHGHVLLMPDGRMRRWGPYGKLENCIRPEDSAQAWLDFVNTDPTARSAWCAGGILVNIPSVAPEALVDEVNRRMDNPCR